MDEHLQTTGKAVPGYNGKKKTVMTCHAFVKEHNLLSAQWVLIVWPKEKHWILFPRVLVSLKCFVIAANSKMEKKIAAKIFVWRRLTQFCSGVKVHDHAQVESSSCCFLVGVSEFFLAPGSYRVLLQSVNVFELRGTTMRFIKPASLDLVWTRVHYLGVFLLSYMLKK